MPEPRDPRPNVATALIGAIVATFGWVRFAVDTGQPEWVVVAVVGMLIALGAGIV